MVRRDPSTPIAESTSKREMTQAAVWSPTLENIRAICSWLTLGSIISDSTSHAKQIQTLHLDLEGQRVSDQFSGQTIPSEKPKERKPRGFRIDRRTISDAILGLSDGLTVPFALSAGLSSLGTTRIVILGGLAELVAGAISMGLGGFLGARSELYACLPATYSVA